MIHRDRKRERPIDRISEWQVTERKRLRKRQRDRERTTERQDKPTNTQTNGDPYREMVSIGVKPRH